MKSFIIGFIQGFTVTTIILIISPMVYYMFIKDKKKPENKEIPKDKPKPEPVGYKRQPINIKTVKDLKDYLNNKDDNESILKLIKIQHDEIDDIYKIEDITITLSGKGKILITLND